MRVSHTTVATVSASFADSLTPTVVSDRTNLAIQPETVAQGGAYPTPLLDRVNHRPATLRRLEAPLPRLSGRTCPTLRDAGARSRVRPHRDAICVSPRKDAWARSARLASAADPGRSQGGRRGLVGRWVCASGRTGQAQPLGLPTATPTLVLDAPRACIRPCRSPAMSHCPLPALVTGRPVNGAGDCVGGRHAVSARSDSLQITLGQED